jgi:hypothetical protein
MCPTLPRVLCAKELSWTCSFSSGGSLIFCFLISAQRPIARRCTREEEEKDARDFCAGACWGPLKGNAQSFNSTHVLIDTRLIKG